MSIKRTRPVGYLGGALKYTITSQDATDGYVEFDFQTGRKVVANIMITDTNGVNQDLADAVIDTSEIGKVKISDGAVTYNTVAGNVIHLSVQRDAMDYDLDIYTNFRITYNGNTNTGGTVPVDSNDYIQGEVATTKTNSGTLVKTGFTFGGWNTKADGTGTTYAVSSAITINGNVTLYAKWDV